ncbi:MAG: DMT family transporter [Bacteroidales bacterium]|nr:DMT family transporter [Bacteroidales bacterium]
MSKPLKQNAYFHLHTAVLLAGGTGLFGRLITIGELPLVWFRVVISAVLLVAILAITRKLSRPTTKEALMMLWCGALLSIHWVFYYGSIKAANISIGAVCFSLVGIMTAVIEPLMAHRRPMLREVLLGMLPVVGIALIFGVDAQYRLGIGLGIISSLIYTFYSIRCKKVQADSSQSSSVMLLYEMIGGTVVLGIAMPVYAKLFPSVALMPQNNDIWFLLLFAAVFTILPFLLQLLALRNISAFTVNLTYNLETVYTILFAMILFNEASELNWSFWVGMLLIVASVAMQTILSIRREKTKITSDN